MKLWLGVIRVLKRVMWANSSVIVQLFDIEQCDNSTTPAFIFVSLTV